LFIRKNDIAKFIRNVQVKRVGKDIEIEEIPTTREEPLISLVYLSLWELSKGWWQGTSCSGE
jgi:hypothetical protein